MKIDAHILCWNESQTLHLTIRHYKAFCRNIYIYDNFSSDNSREIAESMGCIVKPFGIAGQLNDVEYIKVKNSCWKGSDADWVIVCDADEILEIPAFEDKATILRTQGFNMFSNEIPKIRWQEVNTGIKDDNYSKCVMFNPREIQEINYQYGCHQFKPEGPKGNVVFSENINVLLHYKHVGGAQRLADRHALYESRRSDINKRWHMGDQYGEPRSQTIKYFNENLAKARPLW